MRLVAICRFLAKLSGGIVLYTKLTATAGPAGFQDIPGKLLRKDPEIGDHEVGGVRNSNEAI